MNNSKESESGETNLTHGGVKNKIMSFMLKKKSSFIYILAKIHFLCNIRLWFRVWTVEPDSLGVNLVLSLITCSLLLVKYLTLSCLGTPLVRLEIILLNAIMNFK